jgi:glycosyltransferase involved in cell wall biosynthesis
MPELPQASVIVCTRNRAPTLVRAAEALLALDYPRDRWELVVVDNGSTDATAQVVAELAAAQPGLVRIVNEPRAGLSIARNTGFHAARGEVIAFADDDAFPTVGWLRALVEALLAEGALVAGGPVEPAFEGELPAWFDDLYLPYLAAWDRGDQVHALHYNDYPRGNNMALRREVFARFGEFSPHLGRTGRSLLSCEETELCLRVERGGGRIVYAPGARIRHLTVTERITPKWLARRFFAQGRSEAILEWQHAGWRGLRTGWLRWLRICRHVASLAREDPLFARCQRRALLGHSIGFLTAPISVPRYRPEGQAADWLPTATL